jgi:hypothetical protein
LFVAFHAAAFYFVLMCAIRFYVATRIVWNSNLDWNQISLKFIKGFENRKEVFSLNLFGQFSPSGPLPLFLSCSPLCLPHTQPISSVHFWPTSRPGVHQRTAQPASTIVLPGHDLRRTEAKGQILVSYGIFTESEPIWIKVGLEIESNLLTRSQTEKTYKKSPWRSSIPSNLAANPSLAPRRRHDTPPPFPPQLEPCRAPQELGGTIGTHPVTNQPPERPLVGGEPRRRSPAVIKPRRRPPLPRSKLNEFPTSLRFRRRRWRPKRTNVAQGRMYSGELGEPAMEHHRSAWWRRRPLPNLISVVHRRIKGHD